MSNCHRVSGPSHSTVHVKQDTMENISTMEGKKLYHNTQRERLLTIYRRISGPSQSTVHVKQDIMENFSTLEGKKLYLNTQREIVNLISQSFRTLSEYSACKSRYHGKF